MFGIFEGLGHCEFSCGCCTSEIKRVERGERRTDANVNANFGAIAVYLRDEKILRFLYILNAISCPFTIF